MIFHSFWDYLFVKPVERYMTSGAEDYRKVSNLDETPQFLFEGFAHYWDTDYKENESRSLLGAVMRFFKKDFIVYFLLQLIGSVFGISYIILLPFMLDFFENDIVPIESLVLNVIAVILCSLASSFCYYQARIIGATLVMKIRTITRDLIFRKGLRISEKERDVGRVVTLLTADADGIERMIPACTAYTTIISYTLSIILAYTYIGAYSLIHVLFLLVMFPILFILASRLAGIYLKYKHFSDLRLKYVDQFINGIELIKFYGWEAALKKNIEENRALELSYIQKQLLVRIILITLAFGVPVIAISIILFLWTTTTSQTITVVLQYSIYATLTYAKLPFAYVPFTLMHTFNVISVFTRMEEYLKSPERSEYRSFTKEQGNVTVDGTFTWNLDKKPFLKNLQFNLDKGNLGIIIGSTGSGKSSFVNVLLGEMEKVEGEVNIGGNLAYCPQQAWILNRTVKENIIMDRPYNEKKYLQVLYASSLVKDLKQLSHGDQTLIGEKGISLSGGQKQRISIARALYSDVDIYVFDDPLSAVDPHVSKNIFHNAIMEYLIKQDKTVVLVTNALQYCEFGDEIFLFEAGRVIERGSYTELMEDKNGTFHDLMNMHSDYDDEDSDTAPDMIEFNPKRLRKQISVYNPEPQKQEEDPVFTFRILADLIIKSSPLLFSTVVLFILVRVGSSVFQGIWIGIWAEQIESENEESYLYGIPYIIATVIEMIGYFIAGLCQIKLGHITSKRYHDTFLNNVVKGTMKFFYTTQKGKLFNRFSSDLRCIDEEIPFDTNHLLHMCTAVLTILVSLIYGSPFILIVMIPSLILLIWLFFRFKDYSLKFYTDEIRSRDPICSIAADALSGVSSIRAFKFEEKMIEKNNIYLDANGKGYHCGVGVFAWYGLRSELGLLLIVIAGYISIILTAVYLPSLSSIPLVAGSLSLYGMVTTIFVETMLMYALVQVRMYSGSRIKEYFNIPTEEDKYVSRKKVSKQWPANGNVEFREVSFRYNDNQDFVLDDISLRIKAGEKIGVVGRTGAGKSTLTSLLFRLQDPEEGSILIDGVNICDIDIRKLRKRIGIIPQHPILFIGTLRSNLDPFDEYSDDDILNVLRMVELDTFFENDLSFMITDEGDNISVGQKQLVCLARAILRSPKILIMDEATASIDYSTDVLIQKTMRSAFKHSTVITIAHRLNTVIDSDKILFLERGQVMEFDTPYKLLKKPDGHFTKLVNEMGNGAATALRKLAKYKVPVLDKLLDFSLYQSVNSSSLVHSLRESLTSRRSESILLDTDLLLVRLSLSECTRDELFTD
eukprot:TRINITY_DN4565_c0_g1_i1.p2 TRINITY_DN4565_c0_g1~~TRINITY_DN4565_c0_g1_i1.p2  ORF type:complete len:1293 (-),score=273.81 TRINITY_DN4565_c0_g1_i1:3881-7759(-)